MKTIVWVALVSVLMLNLIIASYGSVLSASDLPQVESQLWRLIDSPRTKSLLASKLAEANRIETGVDSKSWLIIFDPSSLALDLFSENEVGVTIEFLFVPFGKQGVFSFLFRWEGPFPKLVDWSYWVWGIEVGGEISEDTTWTLNRSPYYVTSDVSVQSGLTLTIEPGVEVRLKKFSDFSGMKVGLSIHGNLIAEGTDESPIVFTTSCDFEALDQMQGEWLEELQDWFPTDWKGIALGESGIFNYCVVEYGEANIRGGTSLQVSNSYIKGGVDGINFFGVSGAIMNNTITRNGFAAISCGGGTTTVSGNTITVRRGHGAIHHATGQAEVTDNTISVEMEPDAFAYWGILCRTEHEGDTSATIHLNEITGFGSGISVGEDSIVTITSNLIQDCGTGVSNWEDGGLPVINYNNIVRNNWGVRNNDCSITIDAEDNWWGHESGPYHPETNPEGQGDAVSDCVDYDPWATVPY